MSGEVTTADEKSSPDESYEAPSLDSMLGKAQGKESPEPNEPEPTPAPVVEPKAEVVAQDVAPVETPAPDVQLEQEFESPAGKPPKGFVPVQALQAEREKSREYKELLQAASQQNLQQPMQSPQPQYLEAQSPVDIDPNVIVRNQVATMSEKLARQSYPDYDEKFGAFREAMVSNPDTYAPLYNSIMQSENPGEAAYRAGIHILETKKYGAEVVSDPVKYRAAIRKELEAELKPKIESDTHKAIQGKLTERSKTPTDISDARAAGGSSEPEYQPKSFEALHRSVYKPKR